jgi:hypothetical protein
MIYEERIKREGKEEKGDIANIVSWTRDVAIGNQ